jgi:hypothetical protein
MQTPIGLIDGELVVKYAIDKMSVERTLVQAFKDVVR